jgi:hypothetical protein
MPDPDPNPDSKLRPKPHPDSEKIILDSQSCRGEELRGRDDAIVEFQDGTQLLRAF